HDGEASGAKLASAVLTVGNTPPSLSSVLVQPNEPREESFVTAQSFGQNDLDGDAVSLSYEWFVNGTSAGTGTGLDGDSFSRGDTIYVIVTPSDATSSGSPV